MMHNKTIHFARKSNIAHKVEMGILFDLYYDTETTDLDKRFAEITQFGGAITDLAGNVLHSVDLRGRISPYAVPSPYAWVFQRMRLEDVGKGDPRAIFMGKVMKFFDVSSNLPSAPYRENFLSRCRIGKYTGADGQSENYYAYPVLDDDGDIDWDYIRIHENLKKFYFKDAKTGGWIKRDIKSMSIGYNNVNADDQWLWTAAHMAGAENIFMTHLAQDNKYRLDALRVVEAAIVACGKRENGLRAAVKKNPRTGEETLSFKLGDILVASTRLPSELRALTEGIVREDGSYIDVTQLHGALEDSLGVLALMRFIRTHHPDLLRQMEQNSDWKYVIDKLSDVRNSFGNNPPVAYVDKTYPTIDGKMVSLIGTDQYRNSPKLAVVWNLTIDPRTYTYNGRKIGELTEFDWKQILQDSKVTPNAPLKIIRAHKSPRVLDAETGYAAGFNVGLDRTELHDRISYIRKEKVAPSIMKGLRLAFPRLHGADRLILPQPEEELFTFSTLELFDREVGEDVQVHYRLQNKVEEIAQKSRVHIMQIKALWMRAIQFDEDVFIGDGTNISGFKEKIKAINKELKKRGGVELPPPDEEVCDYTSARHYKIKILFFARNYFEEGILQDIGHHFWFEDKDGIRYSDQEIKEWPLHKIDDAIKSGNLEVCHEVTNTTPLILDRIIEDLGYVDILGPEIQARLDAYKSLRQEGMPHLNGQGDRWTTKGRALRDLAKIRANELQDKDLVPVEGIMPGAAEIFLKSHHDNLACLAEYEVYLESLNAGPVRPDQMPLLGIDPQSGYPQRNYDFSVCLEESNELIVPERYIEAPSIDPVTGRSVWVLPLSDLFNKGAGCEKDILLKTSATGRTYHLPNARRVALPLRDSVYEEFYKTAANAYHSSGLELPKLKNCMAIIGNGPYPLFGLRRPNTEAQSLHLPKHMFEGMISPEISGFREAPQGIILRDDLLRVEKGIVRLQEKDKDVLTGWEYEADVEDVRNVSFSDVEKFSPADLTRFGFGTQEQALDYFSSLFAQQRRDPRDKKNKALAIVFGTINTADPARGMMFCRPDAQVMSCVI